MSQPHLVEINQYSFSPAALADIRNNAYAVGNWPLVYILSDGAKRRAYVGETSSALTRLNTHLQHEHKKMLTTAHLISSSRFNKSATLDIESALIKYMAADGCFELLNGNLGLSDHNYYQRNEVYTQIFRETWDKLRGQGIARHSLESIDNSDVFKYSPYKALSFDQRQSLVEMMRALLNDNLRHLVVQGGAGTGKSVLAIFLFKLIHTDEAELNLQEFSDEENELRELLSQLKQRFPTPRMALVVPMASFRATLKRAFKNVAGLRPDMVISPSKLAQETYDIVLVDESHRLRKRVNLGSYYGIFDKVCTDLGLDKDSCSEVDWVTQQAKKAIFFYDPDQSIKPSDANAADFQKIKQSPDSRVMTLTSQFRVQAGQDYVDFIDRLLNIQLAAQEQYRSKKYDFLLFENIADLVQVIEQKNQTYGLARLVAGYAWPWHSKKDSKLHDIEIDNVKLRWNRTNTDWINTTGAEDEVGCIHTTQGYDLNYTGIIFGTEIGYDAATDQITINEKNYLDRNGKQTIKSPEELKQYILNIYKTIMLRGIKGTYVYACDPALRAYLKQHIPRYQAPPAQEFLPAPTLVPWVNAVPFYDLQAAAGSFSELQHVEDKEWIGLPKGMEAKQDMFACRVVGESMNKIIPSGSLCLFRQDPGGSRNGKIVLVECLSAQDSDDGSRFTVKEYESIKTQTAEGWEHKKILLKPRSTQLTFEAIEIHEDADYRYRVVGEFIRILS
ncbi:DUF2075 domain-containing protein [Alcaligenes faecalis]|nr:DNA/RNA helicase domain-containing protein [Alcaligenes faecalis]ARP52358.1 hypothetical protein ALFP_0471 [Alcaligenes faecalis]MBH0311977.1 DUF2075 domain-containing protein [Alcaligenes faecalis]